MSDLGRDLVLKYRNGGVYEEKVILPNIPHHRYTIGSKYPGVREGEEFLFCRYEDGDDVNPTHCVISVDEQGQYWIQNDTRNVDKITTRRSVFNTFVNAERVKALEVRLLKIGDVISLGESGTLWAGRRRGRRALRILGETRWLVWSGCPIYRVGERIIPCSGPHFEEAENRTEAGVEDDADADSPLHNNLVLSEIMSYLSVPDLKNARLVSKKWNEEASKALEKRGQVSFDFGVDYFNPKSSTNVSRYLHEMKGMKIRNLRIRLLHPHDEFERSRIVEKNPLLFTPGEPGEKMLDDIRKLLDSSHNFKTLFLHCNIKTKSDFLPFSLILEELGEKLVELKLKGPFHFLPKVLPQFPVMRNLKKFTDNGLSWTTSNRSIRRYQKIRKRFAKIIVPLFSSTLEHFKSCGGGGIAEFYIPELVKAGMPKLKGISLGVAFWGDLSLLLQLQNPLTALELGFCTDDHSENSEADEYCELFESLLLKHSKSLKRLQVEICCYDDADNRVEIKFPPFPELEELDLEYDETAEINWGTEADMDYKVHFPSLRKLKIQPSTVLDDAIFDSFFPEEGDMRCETVKDLWVAALPVLDGPNQPGCVHDREEDFQPRIDRIREMFPNAVTMTLVKRYDVAYLA